MVIANCFKSIASVKKRGRRTRIPRKRNWNTTESDKAKTRLPAFVRMSLVSNRMSERTAFVCVGRLIFSLGGTVTMAGLGWLASFSFRSSFVVVVSGGGGKVVMFGDILANLQEGEGHDSYQWESRLVLSISFVL